MRARVFPLFVLLAGAIACGGPDPAALDAGTDGGPPGADAGVADAGALDASALDGGDADAMIEACLPLPGDYTPRIAMSETDDWPPCISDVGAYARIEPTISTIARVEAFDAIFAPGGILAGADRDPGATEFTDARALYDADEGLGSRVVRRSDEHAAAPTPSDCRMGSVLAAAPDYCLGPSQLLPIVRAGFVAGQTGAEPPSRVHAARIDAALTFFLYLSPYKESLSCTSTARDCDSAWAYYTGGDESRDGGLGLARLVRSLDREAHDRIWDALLAVRCWRDLDPDPIAGAELELRDRARAQLDRALDRGLALVLIDHLRRMDAASGDERRAHYEWLRVMLAPLPAHDVPSPDPGGGTIPIPARASLADRMIRARDAAAADRIGSEFEAATSADDVDAAEIAAELEALFPCG